MENGDAEKSDTNKNICDLSPSLEIISESEANVTSLENSLTSCVNSILSADGVTATSSQEIHQDIVDFIVIYNKQKININFRIDGTVSELKNYLQNIIAVPQAMQKVMFKGLAKDNQTLRSLGVVKGAKVMIVGSKLDDVLAVSNPTKHDIADDSASAASKEPLSQQKIHRKVLDKGIPEDAMPGILDTKESLPEIPLAGMLNKSGGKVRLTFKLEQDQLWIGTKERTDKIPMNSIKGIHSEPMHDHPEYHIMVFRKDTSENRELQGIVTKVYGKGGDASWYHLKRRLSQGDAVICLRQLSDADPPLDKQVL